jgi:CheY-like chemotaxis protein
MDRIFEPFFSTKPKGEGSGLGLATVYGIITQAGGNVRVYSEPGLGTTVTAFLPVTSLGAAAAAPAAPAPQGGNGEIVLVAEDEPAMREVTRRILARNGYHVIAVAGGQEALAAVTHRLDHIDVLLTDVIMPQMQGKELAGQILALHPRTRVVYMSGYTQGLLSAQGVVEPGIHLIEKPFSEATLLTKLHEVLSGP